jgi:hypothetical protein
VRIELDGIAGPGQLEEVAMAFEPRRRPSWRADAIESMIAELVDGWWATVRGASGR